MAARRRRARARILAVAIDGPRCVAAPPLPDDSPCIVARSHRRSATIEWSVPNHDQRRVGERVAGLLPAGARLQYPPGAVGRALVDALNHTVAIDTGIRASSPAHDVDMVVTETGVANLRGADRAERPRRLRQL
jgi:hypothetical protein